MKRLTLIIHWMMLPIFLQAQTQDTSIFNFPIQMDEVVIKATRAGWDVQGFINRVKTDTTFYKAFKGLRVVPHSIKNNIQIKNQQGGTVATYKSITHQQVKQACRTMTTTQEQVTGDFYDRSGDYNYLTAELYDYLFFTKGVLCNQTDVIGAGGGREKGKLGKYKSQLKQLIFSPGSKINGLPLIGNKASIFEPDIAKMYDFKLLSVLYEGQDCYLFRAVPKAKYKDDVVYNDLSTWFRKSDYSILARDYALSYRTLLFAFDVQMKVRLTPVGSRWLPSSISYNGNWRAVTKGKEAATFTALFSYP